jgi:hypothetical protein
MDPKANPIPRTGERNIYCPFYNRLDYAVDQSWLCWNCSRCVHRLIRQSVSERDYEISEAVNYYELPPNVAREIGKDSFD